MDRRQFLTTTGLGVAAATATATTAASAATGTDDAQPARAAAGRRVRTGAQRLADDGWATLRGHRVGVISNPTGILDDASHIVDSMVAAGDIDLVAVFGPEHGFRGSAQAGDSEGTFTDPRTGVTVYDAYGAQEAGFMRMFGDAGVELVVFDIQDVGARFYTYIWTMWSAMRAAARMGLKFVVLDRPNPIGGTAFGPMLKPGYESGIGQRYIVQQHGMTVGELARLFNAEFLPEDAGAMVEDLEVVPVKGWRPSEVYAATGLPWPPPSPNMPTPDTALAYVGTCLFEGTAASEGRGTTRPFELIGAPYGTYHWADDLNAAELPGVDFREAYYVPTFSKFTGETCGGVQVHVTNPAVFDAIRTGVTMITTLKRRYPDEFAWRGGGTSDGFIHLLHGSDRLRVMVDAGASADEIVASWQDELADFDRLRQQYLIYRGRR
ncbi:uncharacterized protein YbbC (DUF1343 family) [Haloactinopolyspora alba]|uniref:Uncharacterized protein YbbC (DUF1343 family) n=1 Tax=Haloactinopolyspora alba TaxID=648780 RepID=A0A2P8DK03_9ACTN|nr:DUF1343 domain-containing protein [Haloactinopolyspora alba]PSK97534.1 uncharacterized protein YbbC (DUF1343 family) [Haloactinopolyspora alba]